MSLPYNQANANVRWIAIVPAARCTRLNNGDNEQHGEPGGEARPVVMGQKLSNRPGDLYVLWRDGVCFGCQRREASEGLLTVREGCELLCLLATQKNWNAICSLTTKGYTANTAIDKVYEVYGKSKSVTAILDAMIADKQARIERF